MFGLRLSRIHAAIAAATVMIATALPATALNVQPVIVDLLSAGRRSSAVVTLQNAFSTTVPVELTARAVELVDGEFVEVEGEVEDLLIFPAQAIVEPGQSQAFRVQWVGDPAPSGSRHFYVSVAQLPIQLPENENAIQVLYNFRVMVSVAAPDARANFEIRSAEIATTDGRSTPVLEIHNAGNGYGYVGQARMTIVQRVDGQEVFRQVYEPDEIQRAMGLGLLPSGATRRLPVNVELPRADGELAVTLTPVEGR